MALASLAMLEGGPQYVSRPTHRVTPGRRYAR